MGGVLLAKHTRRRAWPGPEVVVIIRTLIAAIAVIAIPMAVVGAQAPATNKGSHSTKKVCDVAQPTGSRLGGVRRCRTPAEREEAKQEARQTVDRIQSMKPTTCPPNC